MSLNEIQDLIKVLYLKQDKQRGLEKTVLWFVSEVGELCELLVKNKELNEKSIKSKIEDEIADVQAWLMSIANLLDIDVVKATKTKYPDKCSRCGNNPCECGVN